MFRRYSVKYFGDIVNLQLKGDVASRRYQWVGALDGLLLSGRRSYVIGLQDIVLSRDSDIEFLVVVGRRIQDVGGEVVFVAPEDAHAQRLLRRSGLSRDLTFVPNVDSGISRLEDAPAAPPKKRESILRWPQTFRRHDS